MVALPFFDKEINACKITPAGFPSLRYEFTITISFDFTSERLLAFILRFARAAKVSKQSNPNTSKIVLFSQII